MQMSASEADDMSAVSVELGGALSEVGPPPSKRVGKWKAGCCACCEEPWICFAAWCCPSIVDAQVYTQVHSAPAVHFRRILFAHSIYPSTLSPDWVLIECCQLTEC